MAGPSVAGLLNAYVASFEVDSEYADDAVIGYGTCTIQTQSYMT